MCKDRRVVMAAAFVLLIYCGYIAHVGQPSRVNHLIENQIKDNGTPLQPDNLSKPIIDGVKTFVMFLGQGRSGHSIVGSILDAHPHMVVAHEARSFLHLLPSDDDPVMLNSKDDIFNVIWHNSVKSTISGWRSEKVIEQKGYTLKIPGLYQGVYQSHIDVIGDKNGGQVRILYERSPSKFNESFHKLKSLIGIPVKVIQVIRNPYDNIATTALYELNHINIASVRKSNRTLTPSDHYVNLAIDTYFKTIQLVASLHAEYELDLLKVHGTDLITDPSNTITSMCNFLGVSCSEKYIRGCEDKLFKEESKTRYKIHWKSEQIKRIQDYIDKHQNLLRYRDFDS